VVVVNVLTFFFSFPQWRGYKQFHYEFRILDRKLGRHEPITLARLVERVARGLHRLYLVSPRSPSDHTDLHHGVLTGVMDSRNPLFRKASVSQARSGSNGNWGVMGSSLKRSISSGCSTSPRAPGCRFSSFPDTSFQDVTFDHDNLKASWP